MTTLSDTSIGGERPLFASHGVNLDRVTITDGESALKASSDFRASNCRFEGLYPFWHCNRFLISDSTLTETCRAALWYSADCITTHCTFDSPKPFREMERVTIVECRFNNTIETLWHCRGVNMSNTYMEGCDYAFMHCSDIIINDCTLLAKYSFQYAENAEIHNCTITTKDAFWNSRNVTVYDSTIDSEYLGWYSENLKLVRCHIKGTQPLCYTTNLIMEDCTMDASCNLCFEDSDLHANILSPITSIKNPRHGHIKAEQILEQVIDCNIMPDHDCVIKSCQSNKIG